MPELDEPDQAGETQGPGALSDVHIRIQQRNGRKCLTIVQGLPKNLNMKKVMQYFKKVCHCNGTIVNDKHWGDILQLTGDQREQVRDFLVNEKICPKERVNIHGV